VVLKGALIACMGFPLGCEVYKTLADPVPLVPDGIGATEKGYRNAERSNRGGQRSLGDQHQPWWRAFRDRDLASLIDEALAQNPDLRAVSRRIDQANARLVQAGSALFPQLDADGELSRRWDVDGDRSDASSIGWVLNWELDAWGRIRSQRAARAREREAAFEDWRSARLLLTAAVGETWFELLEQRGQLQLVGEQIEVNRTLLDLTRLRFGQGQGAAVDVLQQQEQLQSTEALVPDIETRIEELELALEALTGRLPGAAAKRFVKQSATLRAPPALPRRGFPADLLADRPDLRAQRARIVALDHEVGEAIADRFPRFSIGASQAVAGSPSPERVIGDALAGVVAPIFDAGRRKAEVAGRRARVEEEIDLYTAAFLAAVRDVEVALSREAALGERIQRQEAQLATARKLLAESKNRYVLGATDYLPVIDAVSKVQELERSLISSHRERLSSRVGLHRALGGPMPSPQHPAE
jgi:NodT family efflux transporter outer membrane factor (OMF) lipoprotein